MEEGEAKGVSDWSSGSMQNLDISGFLSQGVNKRTEIQIATTEELSFKKKKLDTPLQTFSWNFARVGR